jgi:hypothetical protein
MKLNKTSTHERMNWLCTCVACVSLLRLQMLECSLLVHSEIHLYYLDIILKSVYLSFFNYNVVCF